MIQFTFFKEHVLQESHVHAFLYKKLSFWVSNLRNDAVFVLDGWCGWRASVGKMLLLLLLLLSKYYLKKKNVKCLLLKQKLKNVPNRFKHIIWTGNARILNISKSAKICPNEGKYASICVTLWIYLNMRVTLRV